MNPRVQEVLEILARNCASLHNFSILLQTNAFDVLMRSSERRTSEEAAGLPSPINSPRNKKEELWNAIVLFLNDRNLKWQSKEVTTSGQALVKALVSTLWYIDGHHDVFGQRGFEIPKLFEGFQKYNTPQLSKHRKRERGNLSATEIQTLCNELFGCLQGVYWVRPQWVAFKEDVEQLAIFNVKIC